MFEPLLTLFGRNEATGMTTEYCLISPASLLERLEEKLDNDTAAALLKRILSSKVVRFTLDGSIFIARPATEGDRAYWEQLCGWIAEGPVMPFAELTRSTWGGQVLETAFLDRRALHLALAPEHSLASIKKICRMLEYGRGVTLPRGGAVLRLQPFDPIADGILEDFISDFLGEDEEEDIFSPTYPPDQSSLPHSLAELLDCGDDDGDDDDPNPRGPKSHIRLL